MSRTVKVLRNLILATAISYWSALHAQLPPNFTVSVLPGAPGALDLIIARISASNPCSIDEGTFRIKQAGALVRVDVNTLANCVPTGGSVGFDVLLGKYPAGVYTVSVFQPEAVQVATTQFTVVDNSSKTMPHPLVDYSDWWWTVGESGWGLSIMQHTSDRIFAAWFVYDQAKQPVWYTLQPGQWLHFNMYVGPVYKTTGPYFGGPFDQTQVGITQVGTATLTFNDYMTGTFSYTVEGISGTKSITRLAY